MQEEIENKTVNLAISTTTLTARGICKAVLAWKRHRESLARQKAVEVPKGKMTIKELLGKDQGVSSVPIENTELRDFEAVARRYGIDYAITKDSVSKPPKYTVFFKAKDADAMDAAFQEYASLKLKKQERPSVLAQLSRFKAISELLPEKVRQKSQERDAR